MMKRAVISLLACCLSYVSYAQLNKQAVADYRANVKSYERAVHDIVKNGQPARGVDTLTALIRRCEATDNYPPQELADYYKARAQGYLKQQQYQQSATDCQHALSLLQQAGEVGRKDLTGVWYHLAVINYNWGKPDKAMQAADQCIQTALTNYGPLHTTTLDAYSLRSNLAGFYNQKSKALSDRQAVFQIIQQNVERNFAYLTARERSAYWSRQQPETTLMFAFAHKTGEQESAFTDALYDQQLLAKGLLLTAESALQRAIDNDETLKQSYRQIRRLRQKAANDNTSRQDAEAATLQADRLERELGTTATTLHQFMDFLKIHVADVRQQLTANDVAIEFVDYRVGKDSTMYAALVLSPRWQHVRFIPLIESKEIAPHADNLAPRLWQPIIQALGYSPQHIYFAPSGLLYQYPIESQPLADGRLMCEAYRMHRLSSTRWLAFSGAHQAGSNAVVYGGLVYDESDTASSPSPSGKRGAMEELPYLAGTKTEAEAIAQAINNSQQATLHADLLTGRQGTAASFTQLSGQHKAVVHVATHGFYQPASTTAATSDNALQRSGLYFADSEVLTSEQIAALDLQGLQLTVLSACQTGQGDITSDGVFGLQRGFKKAGAQSILMSLWKVDDEATCLLMTEFYKSWITQKKTKHDALEAAKRTVRSHKEKGWDDPKYWAAFILLDAL